ncbi:hypothetical protein Q8A67_022357 [Cirrhinus molitorella]|uniref:Uncharacterized protein n=1 Tax=Cirrhinus molitorella TaxID=172907 RepID=A0AA88P525_9TELE|nr:hypothetical protein Q8A67_022357 [Cirrhinus molitorella]
MHRQGPNGTGTSFITTELPRRPICALREKEHKRLLFRFPEPVPPAKTPAELQYRQFQGRSGAGRWIKRRGVPSYKHRRRPPLSRITWFFWTELQTQEHLLYFSSDWGQISNLTRLHTAVHLISFMAKMDQDCRCPPQEICALHPSMMDEKSDTVMSPGEKYDLHAQKRVHARCFPTLRSVGWDVMSLILSSAEMWQEMITPSLTEKR